MLRFRNVVDKYCDGSSSSSRIPPPTLPPANFNTIALNYNNAKTLQQQTNKKFGLMCAWCDSLNGIGLKLQHRFHRFICFKDSANNLCGKKKYSRQNFQQFRVHITYKFVKTPTKNTLMSVCVRCS